MRAVPRTIAPADSKPDLTFNGLSLVLVGERVRGRYTSVQLAAGLDRPLERFAVDLDQSEACGVAARPLEVVRIGPVKVAANVDAIADREQHVGQGLGDVPTAPFVVTCGETVLRDVDGFAELAQLIQDSAHPARVRAQAHVGHGTARDVETPDELIPWTPGIKSAHLAPVVSDADVVARRLDNPAQLARSDRPSIENHLRCLRGPTVAPPIRSRQEQQFVM